MNVLNYLVTFAKTHSPIKRQRGATMIEYVLIVGLISIVAIYFITQIGVDVKGIFSTASTKLGNANK